MPGHHWGLNLFSLQSRWAWSLNSTCLLRVRGYILYYCIKSDIINNIQLIIHLCDDSNSRFATISSTVILYYQFNVSVFIQTAIRIMLTHTNVDSFRFTKLTQHSHTMKIVQKIDLFVHFNFFLVFGRFFWCTFTVGWAHTTRLGEWWKWLTNPMRPTWSRFIGETRYKNNTAY